MDYVTPMHDATTALDDIVHMPRGGPHASCLDRALSTERAEYLDRADVAPDVKRRIVGSLEWAGRVFGHHQRFAAIALDEVADVPDPRLLELGAGHGELSAHVLRMHPTAHVTVSDVDPDSVTAIAAGALGSHRRTEVRRLDATAIDAADGAFDLAVFALSFHHLAPEHAARVLVEGTRVADRLLIVDLSRPPAPLHVLRLALILPLAPFVPVVHDGVISSLRAYAPSALRTLAEHAGVDVALSGGFTGPQVLVATRR